MSLCFQSISVLIHLTKRLWHHTLYFSTQWATSLPVCYSDRLSFVDWHLVKVTAIIWWWHCKINFWYDKVLQTSNTINGQQLLLFSARSASTPSFGLFMVFFTEVRTVEYFPGFLWVFFYRSTHCRIFLVTVKVTNKF